VLWDNKYLLGLSGLAIAALMTGWGCFRGFAVDALLGYSILALVPIQLIVCVLAYGGQVQGEHQDVMAAVITSDDLRGGCPGSRGN
jgi:hypothetical protein